MIAGPIKRIQDYVPSLQRASVNPADLWAGASRIALGLCKKAIIADNINLFLADTLLAPNAPDPGGPLTARRVTLAFNLVLYSLRIYLDFSSYSDIAIGSARLFGIHVPENFNWPYLARNPSEFWKRWHISLSRWITDYIYIPLGGSRGASFQRQAFNTVVAMGLSGLWHGAAGNFVVWGLYHALLIILYRRIEPVWRRLVPERVREHAILRGGYVLTNFAAVAIGWAFFATPLSVGFRYVSRLVGLS
jgi:alginate O-acetyltransferase complex protein AlgI